MESNVLISFSTDMIIVIAIIIAIVTCVVIVEPIMDRLVFDNEVMM